MSGMLANVVLDDTGEIVCEGSEADCAAFLAAHPHAECHRSVAQGELWIHILLVAVRA